MRYDDDGLTPSNHPLYGWREGEKDVRFLLNASMTEIARGLL